MGDNLDYSTNPGATDLPAIADTVWTIMTSSIETSLESVQYNDQVVAIYKSEIWDRVKKTKDLDTSEPASNIRQLTEDLAECLKQYGSDTVTSDGTLSNTNFNLPFPADVILTDYTDRSLYNDNSSGKLYGRFPQDITNSETIENIISANKTKFAWKHSADGYCKTQVTDYNEEVWNNWKDHFFYILADDFKPNSGVLMANKCGTLGNCLSINGNVVAAIVFFANEGVSVENQLNQGCPYQNHIY